MRIKEVEERTGLTAKAIRLYESKGLLKPARQSENDYRDYTEEDVARLKTIAILRKLDVSIAEIKEWTDGKVSQADLLHRVSARSMLESEKVGKLVKLSGELLNILEEEPGKPLYEAIEEAEELRQLYEEWEGAKEDARADLFWPLFTTIVALGPILGTIMLIEDGETGKALWGFFACMVLSPVVFWQWGSYFRSDRKRRKAGCLWLIPAAIIGVILAFSSLFFVMWCQQKLFSPEMGWYLFREPWNWIALLYPLGVMMHLAEPLAQGEEPEEPEVKPTLRGRIIGWTAIVAFNLLLFYSCVTGVTFFSGERFVRHSLFHPDGITYELDDVVRVEAGFYGKWNWAPWKDAGDFYYKITFADGKTENWAEPDVCSEEDVEGEPDLWKELLNLDKILMEAGVEKISDWDNREHFSYDPSCLEICNEILNNQ